MCSKEQSRLCSKEPSHRDGSFEYPQHMFWLRNKKKDFYNAPLSEGLLKTCNKRANQIVWTRHVLVGTRMTVCDHKTAREWL